MDKDVYFHKPSKKWIELPQSEADPGLNDNSLEIPLTDESGKMFSAPLSQAKDLVRSGKYRQPSSDQLQNAVDYTEFSTPAKQAEAFLHKAADTFTMGVSSAIEHHGGISSFSDQKKLEKYNPTATMLGGLTGLATQAGIGEIGEGAAATKGAVEFLDGEAAANAGLAPAEGAVAKPPPGLGENELSSLFERDPHQTVQAAMANSGVADIAKTGLDSSLDATDALWNVTKGKKLEEILDTAKRITGRQESFPVSDIPDGVPEGSTVPTEQPSPIESKLSDSYQRALAADAKAGKNTTSLLGQFKDNLPDAALLLGALTGHPHIGIIAKLASKVLQGVPEEGVDLASKVFTRSLPDASGIGFKSLASFAGEASKGLNAINKGVSGIFEYGAKAASKISDKEFSTLSKAAAEFQTDPSKFLGINRYLSTYAPQHAEAQTQTFARAMAAINAARPQNDMTGMLDNKSVKPGLQNQEFKNVVSIVQNPTSILNNVSLGTLTQKQLDTFKSVYPDLYSLMSDKVVNEIIKAHSKGTIIPYKKRLAAAMFTGMPLDSTMTPQAIAMNQPKPMQAPQQQQGGRPPPIGATKELGKLPGIYQTQSQAREAKRVMR